MMSDFQRAATFLFYMFVILIGVNVAGHYLMRYDGCLFSLTPLKFFLMFGLVFILSAFGPAQKFRKYGGLAYSLVLLLHIIGVMILVVGAMIYMVDYWREGFC